MDIGKRLQEVRLAKGLSQGDIERRTGLLRVYLPRIENGHDLPHLKTLEKLAGALDLELYQLFYTGEGEADAPKAPKKPRLGPEEESFLKVLTQLTAADRQLLLALAKRMGVVERRR